MSNNQSDTFQPKEVESVIPQKRQQLLNYFGWGYDDSRFVRKDQTIYFTSPRYLLDAKTKMENFEKFVGERFIIDHDHLLDYPLTQLKLKPAEYPTPHLNETFFCAIKNLNMDFSTDGEDRLMRSHGQTVHEIYELRLGKFNRIPDIVVWPKSHRDVEKIVKFANDNDVVIICFGGGTSVSGAITCPQNEKRSIVILDTSKMNRLLWLNKENLTACFESGIVGQDLERVLYAENLVLGHEPDSSEFSTLGGWVATRASGMKKNVYGNIEDIVLKVKMVTTKGVYEKKYNSSDDNAGPNFDHFILGSEGTLGVITEVEVKVRPMPEIKKFGSLVFPDFSTGIKFLREIALKRCQPASIRLMDNEQFLFGQAMKATGGVFEQFIDGLKKFLLTTVKGYDWKEISVTTLLFEGEKKEVERQEKMIYNIASKYNGLKGGEKNGERGYILTYVIAYIRDFGLDYGLLAESFETSVSWSKCENLCDNVKACVNEHSKKNGINHFYISCRITQTYDVGACVYFYYGFQYNTINDKSKNPIELYEEIESKARDEILASGGTVSHHHGIGKIRKQWYKKTVSQVGVNLYKATKLELDPKNIFACNNFLMPEDQIDFKNFHSKL